MTSFLRFGRSCHYLTTIPLFIAVAATGSLTRADSTAGHTFSPADFGAKLDGVTNDQVALQRAIDAAAAANGGVVAIPSGHALMTGSFELKSKVTLNLEAGSRIIGSTQQADYKEPYLVKALRANDIAITGTGLIDGRGTTFMLEEGPYICTPKEWRPKLMLLEDCHHVRVSDITIRDAAQWSLHLAGCEDVVVHGISIFNSLKVPNCDGIDPDHSRNVRISDCYIECGDDCIVLKTSREFAQYGPCEDIIVTNCVFNTHDCALKIGSETMGDVRNVVFSNCVIKMCHRGVGVMLRDEGIVENLVVSNIVIQSQLFFPTWWGSSEAIYVNAHPRAAGGKVGHVRGLRFSQIVARGEAGVFVQGTPEFPVEDIVLDNVTLDISKVSEWPSRFDLRPPEDLVVEEKGTIIAGVHLQDARGVTLRDCTVRWGPNPPASYGPALRTERVTDLKIENFKGVDAHAK